jgi:hypothetical protein
MGNLSAVSRDEWRFDRNRCRSRPRPKPTVVDQERATGPGRFADIHDQVSANVSFLYGRVSLLDPQGSSNCPHNGHSICHLSHDRPISRDEPRQRTSASIGHARHGGLFAKCDDSDDLCHRLGFPHAIEQRAPGGLLYPLWQTLLVLLSDCGLIVVIWLPAAFFSALPCVLLNLMVSRYRIQNPFFYVFMDVV